MKSNSNFNITKVTVDPTSQEITGLEINGEKFTSGEDLEIKDDQSVEVQGISSEISIEIPEGEAWTGTITLFPAGEP